MSEPITAKIKESLDEIKGTLKNDQIHIITGGTGYLGGFLINELLARGVRIIVIARSNATHHFTERVRNRILAVNSKVDIIKLKVIEGNVSVRHWEWITRGKGEREVRTQSLLDLSCSGIIN